MRSYASHQILELAVGNSPILSNLARIAGMGKTISYFSSGVIFSVEGEL